jgi:hypothetical protein
VTERALKADKAPGAAAPVAQRDLAKELDAARSGGAPLPRPARSELEHGLGADLAGVRLHRGSEADALAEALGATALTSGTDVFLHRSAPEPSTPAGRRLLTHEVFHVLQQRAGPVEGTQGPDGLRVSRPGDRHERAARAAVEQISRGRRLDVGAGASASSSERSGSAVQRQTPEMETAAGAAPVVLTAGRALIQWTNATLYPSEIAALTATDAGVGAVGGLAVVEGEIAVGGAVLGPGVVATGSAAVATEATIVTGTALTGGTITVAGGTVAEGTLLLAETAMVTGTAALGTETALATTGAVGGAVLVSNPVGWIVLGVIVVVGVGVAAGVAVYLITREAPYEALSVEPVKGSMAPVRRPPPTAPAPVATAPPTRGTGKGSMAPIPEPLEAPGLAGGTPVREPATPAPATAPGKGGMAPVREPEAVGPALAPGAQPVVPMEAAGTKRLEGSFGVPVFRADGKQITDIDEIRDDILWEIKDVYNVRALPDPDNPKAVDIATWVADEIRGKLDAYLEARTRPPLALEYANAPIGFKFTSPVKLPLANAIWLEIEQLQVEHPDVEIVIEWHARQSEQR